MSKKKASTKVTNDSKKEKEKDKREKKKYACTRSMMCLC
jgi:hypothetical protein